MRQARRGTIEQRGLRAWAEGFDRGGRGGLTRGRAELSTANSFNTRMSHAQTQTSNSPSAGANLSKLRTDYVSHEHFANSQSTSKQTASAFLHTARTESLAVVLGVQSCCVACAF